MTRLIPSVLKYVALPLSLLAVPSLSHGHAILDSPRARDFGIVGSDGHKDPTGPCGGVASTGWPTYYQQVGSTVQVKFTETVDHPGCFLIAISDKTNPTAQSDFTQLANIKHSAQGSTPRPYTANVKLPTGMACPLCTLQMRQIMLNDDTTPCPPATIPQFATYYSCADIQIGGSPPVDMAVAPIDASTGPVDMAVPAVDAATAPTMPSGGCHISPGATAGNAGLFLLFGAVGLLLSRRRQRT